MNRPINGKPARRPPSPRPLAVAVGLAALSVLPYLQTATHGFIRMDDPLYVAGNPLVASGITWEGIRAAFASFQVWNWHPLTMVSHMIDVSLFGMDPGMHHLVNALFHGANAVLLFLVLFRMTGALWRSAAVAALFGIHPLHVESVAWISERKDVLSALFFLLALLAYERYVRRGGAMRYALVAGLLALGLLAKPMLVTAPAVLLLLDIWPLRRTPWLASDGDSPPETRNWGYLVLEKAPFLGLAVASAALTFRAQQGAGGVFNEQFPFPDRVANALVAYAKYLGKTVWPSGLAIYYPHDGFPAWWQVGGSALLLAGLTAVVVRRFRAVPAAAVGWFWFLGTLVPAIGLVQVGTQALADRYTYLPLVGIFMAVAWEAAAAVPASWRFRPGALACAAAAILALAAVSFAQVRHWKDTDALFTHALSVTSDNWMIQHQLGVELAQKGEYGRAIAHLREAVRLRPDFDIAVYDLAMAYNLLAIDQASRGLTRAAEGSFLAALALRPGFAEGHCNLASLLAGTGRREEAMARYREALRIRPGFPAAAEGLARLQGR